MQLKSQKGTKASSLCAFPDQQSSTPAAGQRTVLSLPVLNSPFMLNDGLYCTPGDDYLYSDNVGSLEQTIGSGITRASGLIPPETETMYAENGKRFLINIQGLV